MKQLLIRIFLHWETTILGLAQLVIGTGYQYLISLSTSGNGISSFNWDIFWLQLAIAVVFAVMKNPAFLEKKDGA